ncbi:hypothetical protein O6H91_05G087900 [Diphasiastrum complanatum]|uniref:Uncharacterized protein n=1 Tax=Diphasiastrum complanatum TaxID=34168 RepID=A0ACC2DQS0_DIPCM|nr:hypothetical protein O6H91_05G087900 [Diphasiastrum complanatum]
MVLPVFFVLECLCNQLIKLGAKGLQELALILNTYEQNGRFQFLEFLVGLRRQLNDFRQRLVVRAFRKLDQVQADGFDVDDAENKVKLIVYKNRIRIREFFRGFDKLRLRLITDTQFAAGLDNANVKLSPRELKALMDEYRVPKDPEFRVCYTAFCDEIDTVFTCKELEKMPWKEVPPVPHIPGLAPERFHMGITYLGPEKEEMIKDLLDNLRKECKAKRISVKGFFEDAAHNKNSSKSVGHVTKQQFSQALSSKAGLKIRPDDLSLLVEKFDENYSGMVNYVAFSSEIDPFEEIQNIAP